MTIAVSAASCGRNVCSDGFCPEVCAFPLVSCGNEPSTCVDLRLDANHCGTCGKACPQGQQCEGGVCSCPPITPDPCSSGTTAFCVDSKTDVRNCGECGRVCPPGQLCASGVCQCPDSKPDACSDGCTDTATDPNNCLTCGTVCAPGKKCTASGCVETCASGFTACPPSDPTYCANLQTDANNCNACGTTCPSAQRCVAGVCSCPANRPNACGSGDSLICVDSLTDSANCGTCGHSCGFDPCVDGECAHWVFVSSAVYFGSMGGLSGADANCQGLADSVSLHGQFKAWLSDDNDSPLTRFSRPPGPYVLVDRSVVAQDWSALTSGQLSHAINLTEKQTSPSGNPLPCESSIRSGVWTATYDNGELSVGYDCANWSSDTSDAALWGNWDSASGGWSFTCGESVTGGSPPWMCLHQFPIYCFEQ